MKEDAVQGRQLHARESDYLHEEDIERSDVNNGGRYVVAQRTAGKPGRRTLMKPPAGPPKMTNVCSDSSAPVSMGISLFKPPMADSIPTLDAKGTETLLTGRYRRESNAGRHDQGRLAGPRTGGRRVLVDDRGRAMSIGPTTPTIWTIASARCSAATRRSGS